MQEERDRSDDFNGHTLIPTPHRTTPKDHLLFYHLHGPSTV
jgi:hypothetical protein